MLVSYKWLQTFFQQPLPSTEELSDIFNFHLCEVESISDVHDDKVFDLNILPDRAPYLLSHRAIALEISALIDNIFVDRDIPSTLSIESMKNPPHLESGYCDRYMCAEIMNIAEKNTPEWIAQKLISVGQKSINPIVDICNFVMLDIGQPLHAFDATKVSSNLIIRNAKSGEKINTLDNKEVVLDESITVIYDSSNPLAIAGIKGGKIAEVSGYSQHILLESAHFNAEKIRETSKKIKIKNDSSKRFENGVSIFKSKEGLYYALSIIKQEFPDVVFIGIFDSNPILEEKRRMNVSLSFIRSVLGKDVSTEMIEDALSKIGFFPKINGDDVEIIVSEERKDILIAEDVAEEVGRVVGYDKIEGTIPKHLAEYKPISLLSLSNSIRNFLINEGYSEIYTYTLTDHGYAEIENPLATDKNFVRDNLSDAMEEKLKFNLHHADLLGLDKIKVFEIGNITNKNGEELHLSVGVAFHRVKKGEKVNEEIKIIRDKLIKLLPGDIQTLCSVDDSGGIINLNGKQIGLINNKEGILEMNLNPVIDLIKNPEDVFVDFSKKNSRYSPISSFPFVSRDIAVFVPGGEENREKVLEIIQKYAGDLLVRTDLFDVFTKEGKEGQETKTSFAYRLIFQSHNKTLTDKEVNESMERIAEALNKNSGWQVR